MKIISAISQKGGVGKSTLIFNLACNLRNNAKVCVVDMDLQGSLLNIQKLSEVEIFGANELDNIIQSNYDFVFIDTPPYLSNNLEKVCSISDVIIIPTKAGILDLLAIRPTTELIKKLSKVEKSLIVLNMVKPNTTLTEEIKNQIQEFNINLSKTIISDLVTYARSVVYNGVEDNNKAQKQIDNLTKEVLTLSMK